MAVEEPSRLAVYEAHEDGRGGSITFLHIGDPDDVVRFRMVLPKGLGPPARERHPHQTKRFHVLRGVLDLGLIDGRPVVLPPGAAIELPPGTVHLPRNVGEDELVFEAELDPGRRSPELFRDVYRVVREREGLDQFLGLAAIFDRHREEVLFPWPVQVGLAAGAWVARWTGRA